MSSLMQFQGSSSRKGVHLEFYQTIPNPQYPDLPTSGQDAELVVCSTCGRKHPRIYIAVRQPVDMLGCWVRFRINGKLSAPDLSVPIATFKLPRDAKPVSDEENARMWHRT